MISPHQCYLCVFSVNAVIHSSCSITFRQKWWTLLLRRLWILSRWGNLRKYFQFGPFLKKVNLITATIPQPFFIEKVRDSDLVQFFEERYQIENALWDYPFFKSHLYRIANQTKHGSIKTAWITKHVLEQLVKQMHWSGIIWLKLKNL